MNIFYIDEDPRQAAQDLFDVHVKKMPIESAQMLANCYTLEQLSTAPLTQKGTVRKHYNPNHPCCKWVLEDYNHFKWLLRHAIELSHEHFFRFDKVIFTDRFIDWCLRHVPNYRAWGTWCDPPKVMLEELRVDSTVEAYRKLYHTKIYDKAGRRMDVWTRRQKPKWWMK